MRRVIHSFLLLGVVVGIAAIAVAAVAEEKVQEKSTKTQFPKTVSFPGDYKTFNLNITGLSMRSKFWVDVYGMAHYMEGNKMYPNKRDALTAALSDQYARQITLAFVRDVGADKIQDAFREGFKKNSSKSEMAEISALVDKFVGFFGNEIKKGERMVFRAVPGGKVTTIIQGEEQDAIGSVTFARVLWRIWLDKHSIVDRDRLVKMVVED
jgi:hypothetical protein